MIFSPVFEESLFEAVNIADALLKSSRSARCERIFLCSIDIKLMGCIITFTLQNVFFCFDCRSGGGFSSSIAMSQIEIYIFFSLWL